MQEFGRSESWKSSQWISKRAGEWEEPKEQEGMLLRFLLVNRLIHVFIGL